MVEVVWCKHWCWWSSVAAALPFATSIGANWWPACASPHSSWSASVCAASTNTFLPIPFYQYLSTNTSLSIPFYQYPSTNTSLSIPLYQCLSTNTSQSYTHHCLNSIHCLCWIATAHLLQWSGFALQQKWRVDLTTRRPPNATAHHSIIQKLPLVWSSCWTQKFSLKLQ